MKKCSYCGKEYPDSDTICEVDQTPLRPITPPPLTNASSATPPAGDAQQIIDNEHLKMLSIFHYVIAGLSLAGILFLFLHFLIMTAAFTSTGIWQLQKNQSAPPVAIMIPIFMIFYIIFGGLMAAIGVLNLLSARFIPQRKHRTFSLIVAGLDCLQVPFGTVLGVFTIIVLSRPSVRGKYAG